MLTIDKTIIIACPLLLCYLLLMDGRLLLNRCGYNDDKTRLIVSRNINLKHICRFWPFFPQLSNT